MILEDRKPVTRTAFMSIAAAEMNLGDMFIRRAVTRLLAEHGVEAVVFTGRMGASYVDAFEFPRDWICTSSPWKFVRLLCRKLITRQAAIIIAPAPATLDKIISISALKRWGVTSLLASATLLGNSVIVLGRAVRGSGRLTLFSEKLIAKFSLIYLARDSQTARIVGCGSKLAPDLGFAASALRVHFDADSLRARKTIALSFRRMPDVRTLSGFVSDFQSQGYDFWTVTQVREDRTLNKTIAQSCGIEHLDWPDWRSHLDQESLVARMYSNCVAVVSDRLHALIIGGRYGAIPVIADRSGEDKLHATLDVHLNPQSVWLYGDRECQTSIELDLSPAEAARTHAAFAAATADLERSLLDYLTSLNR